MICRFRLCGVLLEWQISYYAQMLKPLNMKNKKKPFVHSDHPATPFYGLYSGRSGCGEGVRTKVCRTLMLHCCVLYVFVFRCFWFLWVPLFYSFNFLSPAEARSVTFSVSRWQSVDRLVSCALVLQFVQISAFLRVCSLKHVCVV